MENQYQHTVNGQSVLTSDLNGMGEASALADDRVLAELFRLTPYDGSTVSRALLGYGHATSGRTALVASNGASGNVTVNPFRAIIGSRTAVASNGKKNWRDIRSAIAVGSTTLTQTASFTANASGNPRWDLVYAAVAVDANAASVTRKVKDPTTLIITGQTVVTQLATTVTIGVLAGTAAASPVWPSAPSDSGGTYYVPLAYVRIPNGFGAASTVAATDIAITAPMVSMGRASGGLGATIANATLPTAKQQSWGSSGTRPNTFLPTSVGAGGTTFWFLVDVTTGTESHANDEVIDTRDWRGRLCEWAVNRHGSTWRWEGGSAPAFGASTTTNGIGSTVIGSGGSLTVAAVNGLGAGTGFVQVVVDSSNGNLKIQYGNAPNVKVMFKIDFSGVFENAE